MIPFFSGLPSSSLQNTEKVRKLIFANFFYPFFINHSSSTSLPPQEPAASSPCSALLIRSETLSEQADNVNTPKIGIIRKIFITKRKVFTERIVTPKSQTLDSMQTFRGTLIVFKERSLQDTIHLIEFAITTDDDLTIEHELAVGLSIVLTEGLDAYCARLVEGNVRHATP